VPMCVYVCICVYMCVYVCICVYMCVYVCICVYMYIYVYIYICIYVYIYITTDGTVSAFWASINQSFICHNSVVPHQCSADEQDESN
jgi:hypothetical protein